MRAIIDRGVMRLPAVHIDERKKIEGKLPKVSNVESWLRAPARVKGDLR